MGIFFYCLSWVWRNKMQRANVTMEKAKNEELLLMLPWDARQCSAVAQSENGLLQFWKWNCSKRRESAWKCLVSKCECVCVNARTNCDWNVQLSATNPTLVGLACNKFQLNIESEANLIYKLQKWLIIREFACKILIANAMATKLSKNECEREKKTPKVINSRLTQNVQMVRYVFFCSAVRPLSCK